MLSIHSALALLASLGLVLAEAPARPAGHAITGPAAAARVAKRRRARRAAVPAAAPAASPADGALTRVGPNGRTEITFELMRVMGQTTRAGELRVLERRPTGLTSLVRLRAGYRTEIIQTVFPHKAVVRGSGR